MRNRLDGGEAILEAFRRLGVEYVMASPGSEWGAVWEAFARQDASGADGPRYLSCAHETLAVNLAMGYSAMTGRMQAVMLHTGVGLLQGAIGIDAANRQAIPMVIVSGESASYGEQPGFDPGPQWQNMLSVVGGPHALASPIAKWSHPVSGPHTLHEQLVRAGEMARRAPAGPVFMTVPIETMLHEWDPPEALGEVPPAARPRAPGEEIDRVAALLAAAREPLAIAESIGRDPEGREALVALAELLAMPVCESRWADFSNFPRDHPLHQGIGIPEEAAGADVVLTLRSRTPWPPGGRPAGATVVNVDETPFRQHMVHQNLQADLFLEGDAVATLRRLAARLEGRDLDRAAVAARRARWAAAHDRLTARRRALADDALARGTISAVGLCAAMNAALPGEAIYVNETITHKPLIMEHLDCCGPLSYYTPASGGLGQGLGLALGVKLAMRDRPVVAAIGDGSFMYNPVVQALALSRHEDLPVLVVIFDNGGYSAMRKEHHAFYPDGVAAAANESRGHGITGFDYSELARPFGFHGRRVDKTADLVPALSEAMDAVSGGRAAILDVVLDEAPAAR